MAGTFNGPNCPGRVFLYTCTKAHLSLPLDPSSDAPSEAPTFFSQLKGTFGRLFPHSFLYRLSDVVEICCSTDIINLFDLNSQQLEAECVNGIRLVVRGLGVFDVAAAHAALRSGEESNDGMCQVQAASIFMCHRKKFSFFREDRG